PAGRGILLKAGSSFMAQGNSATLPASVGETLNMLGSADYIADRSLATAVHLSLHLKRPLFLEGEAGVGKTEIAKVLAIALKRRLIRLQCYEGLDVSSAVYEWDYARQMIEIRLAEAAEEDRGEIESTIFSDRFLIKRPLLQALAPEIDGPPVLLIVELAQRLRKMDLFKRPGIAETIDWAEALMQLDVLELTPEAINDTLGVLLKYQDDIVRIQGSEAARLLEQVKAEIAAAPREQ